MIVWGVPICFSNEAIGNESGYLAPIALGKNRTDLHKTDHISCGLHIFVCITNRLNWNFT